MNKYKKTAKWLLVLWVISYILFGCLVSIVYQSPENGKTISAINFFTSSRFVSMVALVVYFYPLLFAIQHYAKLAQSKIILTCTRIVLVQHIIWFVLAISDSIEHSYFHT
jgi:hypothetical protein